ncbi:MAG: S4 domain-containing protein [Candidatus Marsarchaeota archaeon]|jgi:small subunit ribosomal protein S4e|nr:S4 domain-containing protein [Candidatus Marsarchaeota archaeon]
MSKKGGSRHIKGLVTPRYMDVGKKQYAYTIKPAPGRHSGDKSIALSLLLRKLGLVQTAREARIAISSGSAKVNGKIVRDIRFPIGINDIVEVEKAGKSVAIGIDNVAHMAVRDVSKSDRLSQLFKVVGKHTAKGGLSLLRLHDGRLIKASKDARVNDSVSLSEGEVDRVFKMAGGSKCLVVSGVHVGTSGSIVSITPGTMHVGAKALVKVKENEQFETLVKNIMVTG